MSEDEHNALEGLIQGETIDLLRRKIARLESENARLREALDFYGCDHPDPNQGPWGSSSDDFGKRARAALGKETP